MRPCPRGESRVTSLLQDSRGYLWVGTFEGLCRFDGTAFERFGPRDGLGGLTVCRSRRTVSAACGPRRTMASRSSGPRRGLPSTCHVSSESGDIVSGVCVDERGAIWCETLLGLFVAVEAGGAVAFELVRAREAPGSTESVGRGRLIPPNDELAEGFA